MSIAAIVLGVPGGGIFVWTTDFGGIGAFCTLVVGITALVNKCAGFHNACCYKVLWIIEVRAVLIVWALTVIFR